MYPDFDYGKLISLTLVFVVCCGIVLFCDISTPVFILLISVAAVCHIATWRMVGDWKHDRDDAEREKRLKKKAEKDRLDQVMGRK